MTSNVGPTEQLVLREDKNSSWRQVEVKDPAQDACEDPKLLRRKKMGDDDDVSFDHFVCYLVVCIGLVFHIVSLCLSIVCFMFMFFFFL